MFYVYILKSTKDSDLYIGFTSDLKRRIIEHAKGMSPATKYRRPFDLAYYEAYSSQADAEEREKRLKTSSGAYVSLKRRITRSLRQGHFV
jgi:putative endonuclease